jgi:hypothetical protein
MVNNSNLQTIANDICAAANIKFSQQQYRYESKWVIDNEKYNSKSFNLISIAQIDGAVFDAINALKEDSAYLKLKEYFESIESVQNILLNTKDNFFTQPTQILAILIKSSFLSSTKCFSPKILLEKLNEVIVIIDSGVYEVTLVGRLHGIKLETDLIEIESDIYLTHLDTEAINERQPLITTHPTKIATVDYSDSNVEITIKEQYKIVGHNDWQGDLNLKLENVVKAIKLYKHGRFQLYPITFCNSLTGGMGLFGYIEPKLAGNNVTLSDTDIDGLKKAFSVVKLISQDTVLERSFSRFLIGLDERIPEEQLVDFVIAWESILQTVNGTSNKAELVYRFSLNGAALLCEVDNSREFTQTQAYMKKVYEIRSTIVHGGDSKSINSELKKLGFNSLSILNDEFAELYRKVIFWLSTIEKEDRPYQKKAFGWELLLRK